VIEAALDLGLWDQAIDLTQQILESRAAEPLPHYILAKTIIRQAEFAHLCEIFDVTHHKPASNSLSSERFNQCSQYLNHALEILEAYRGEQLVAEYAVTNDQIYRWQRFRNHI
jgi:hypothetical protein